MRVLVSGHDGYIGAVLVKTLERAGHDVAGLDTGYYADCSFGDGIAELPARRLDLREVTAGDVAGFEAVIHLAALSNDPLGELAPHLTEEINYRGSLALARAARQSGVRRFLFASSCSLYGSGGEGLVDETAPLRPLTPYAVSKVRTEEALLGLASADFSPVLLRNATVYGVSPRLRVDLVVNNLVGWAVTTGQICLSSDGTPWRPVVHVEDVAQAFAAALVAPRELVHGQAFNVGVAPDNLQVRELAQIVARAVPGCAVRQAPGSGPDRRSYRVDFRKLTRTLPEFLPAWNVARGAEQLRDAYRANHLSAADFLGRRYTRLQQIQHLRSEGLLDERLYWVDPAKYDRRRIGCIAA